MVEAPGNGWCLMTIAAAVAGSRRWDWGVKQAEQGKGTAKKQNRWKSIRGVLQSPVT